MTMRMLNSFQNLKTTDNSRDSNLGIRGRAVFRKNQPLESLNSNNVVGSQFRAFLARRLDEFPFDRRADGGNGGRRRPASMAIADSAGSTAERAGEDGIHVKQSGALHSEPTDF
ncbi:hypothetical protein HK096_000576 [Nowakowskiella sp. JEL0078]|nr:hypothetical protein HK096_000576 [Nowakowskiella sp. JEL0078]